MTAPASIPRAPWLEIWLRPRAAIRRVIDGNDTIGAFLFSAAFGVVQTLARAANNHLGTKAPAPLIVLLSLLIGAIWGVVQLYLFTGLLYLVGRWTNARAPFSQLRTAIGWAGVPQAATLALWLLVTLALGRSLYLDPELVATAAPLSGLLIAVLYLTTVAFWGWWFVILVNGLAVVQQVSALRAIGHAIAAMLVLMAAFLVMLALVALLFWR